MMLGVIIIFDLVAINGDVYSLERSVCVYVYVYVCVCVCVTGLCLCCDSLPDTQNMNALVLICLYHRKKLDSSSSIYCTQICDLSILF